MEGEPIEDSDDSEEDSWYEEHKVWSDNDENIVLDEFGEDETEEEEAFVTRLGRSICNNRRMESDWLFYWLAMKNSTSSWKWIQRLLAWKGELNSDSD